MIRAHLTSKGKATIEGVFPSHVGFVEGLMSALEPGEQQELRGLLKKLGKSIREEDGSGEGC